MLHLILLILKIIGIVLLVLLGILLTGFLLLLFVPLRYRAKGEYLEKPRGQARISWLLHLLSARLSYDGAAVLTVRLLGIRVFSRQLYPEPEPQEDGEDGVEEEGMVQAAELSPALPPPGTAGEKEPPAGPSAPPENQAERLPVSERTESAGPTETERALRTAPEKSRSLPPPRGACKHDGKKDPEEKETVFSRLIHKFRRFVKRIKERLARLRDRFYEGTKSAAKVRNFLQDEKNKKTFALIFTQGKKLLFHILPRRLSGRLRFGFDDPYQTGRALAAVSPFYGLYAKRFQLEPVFTEKTLEGEFDLKGHIRAATLLYIGLKVLLNKNFRVLLKKWRRMTA